jgi:hypothetical protein
LGILTWEEVFIAVLARMKKKLAEITKVIVGYVKYARGLRD